jgi:hypothetical protein
MGWAKSDIAPTPQQLRLLPSGGYASVGAWHGGNGDKENSRNFRRRRSSQLPVSPRTAGFLSVSVHAAFGGGGPGWQLLNGADRHALLARCQSESVLAGGNGDGGFQLRRLRRSSIGWGWQAVAAEEDWFLRRRSLNLFNVRFVQ